jgi:hypothetical protein
VVPSHGLLQRSAIQQTDQNLGMLEDVDKIVSVLLLSWNAITEIHL